MFWAYNQSWRKSAYNERTLHFISKTIHWIFHSWEVSWFKANDTSRHFYHSVQFSCSVVSDSLRPHGLQRARLPCPSPTPRACSNSCPLSQWCHPIISLLFPSPPAFNLSQHEGLFKWVSPLHQVAKVLEFQQKHQPSNEYSALISFRIDWLVWSYSPRDSQESSPTPQFKSITSSALSFLYSPTLLSIHDSWKTIALTRRSFVVKVMSLLLNMLSRLVITFLPRSKCLSSKEQMSFNFMGAVTFCSDFGA